MKASKIAILENTLDTIEGYIQFSDRLNQDISKADVAWHLDHSLKVINAVTKTMEQSNPAEYKNNFKLLGRIVLSLNYIPRGKGKAPKHVIPPETISVDAINTQLAEARENIKIIPNLDTNSFFKHPLFGNINTARVVRFLTAHSKHHLKIVRDILK